MFVCALSEQERRGCLAPGQGGQSWGVGGPQGVGVSPPPPPRGVLLPNPLLLRVCPGQSGVPQPAEEGGREGGEVLAQPSAAEEPGRRGCSKKYGRPTLDLLSPAQELAGSGWGSTALASRRDRPRRPRSGRARAGHRCLRCRGSYFRMQILPRPQRLPFLRKFPMK